MGAQWTAAHRAFPVLAGLGVMAALVVVAWIPPPRWIAFFALPLLIAPPLGALSTLGMRGTVPWLGGRHAVAALAAVATAMVPIALAAELTHAHADSNMVEIAEFAAVIASAGSLAGWLALRFERFADAGTGLPPLGRTRWNPRRWGVAGNTGVTLFLSVLTVPAWAFFIGGPYGGGSGIVVYYALWAGVVAALSLVIGLTVEATRGALER